MKLAKCPHCGAGLDLTQVPPGSAVSCGGCGKPFWVAAGAPVAPAPPAPVQRRPAPPPPPPPPSRNRAPAHRKRTSRSGGKSPVPIIVGFGGLVAVVVLGLSWMVFSKGGPKAPPGPPPAAGPVARAQQQPVEKPKTPIEIEAEN